MTKFIIRDGNKLFLKERTHSDNMFLGSSFRETDLRTELKPDNIKKIFENPITAIVYTSVGEQHNIEMDKKSLTKALDFWINDKVLQNEKILFLEGKLDDVHEIELKNLIELREFVQKQDNGTVFTRFRGNDNCIKKSSWNVEFFVKEEPSGLYGTGTTVYNFRDNFRDGTRFDFSGLSDEISFRLFGGRHDTPSGADWSASFSTAANHASEALNELGRELSRSGAGTDSNRTFTLPVGTVTEIVGIAGEALRPGDLISRDTNTGRWIRHGGIVMGNEPVLVNFRPVAFGEMVEAVRQGSFNVTAFPPPSIGRDTLFTSTLVMADRTQNIRTTRRGLEYLQNKTLQSARMVFNNMRVDTTNIEISQSITTTISFIGEDGIRLTLILLHTRNRMNTLIDDPNAMDIELLGDHEVRIDGDEYRLSEISNAVTLIYDGSNQEMRLRMEPSHPDLPSFQIPDRPPNAAEVSAPSNRIQDITFENLTIHTISETMEAGSNNYVITTCAAQNGQYEMTFDLYVTGREIDSISEGFRTHTMRILEEQGRIEIDGQRLYCASYTIRERIRNVTRPMRFENMIIHEISSRAQALGNPEPFVYNVTLMNHDGREIEIEVGIVRNNEPYGMGLVSRPPSQEDYRIFGEILRDLQHGLHEVRILPNNIIQIGIYRFTMTNMGGELLTITYSSR